jgi:hypothetical protein
MRTPSRNAPKISTLRGKPVTVNETERNANDQAEDAPIEADEAGDQAAEGRPETASLSTAREN